MHNTSAEYAAMLQQCPLSSSVQYGKENSMAGESGTSSNTITAQT